MEEILGYPLFVRTSRSVKLCDMLVAGDRRPEPPVYQAASERGVTTNGTTNIYDSNYVPPGVVHVVRDTGPPFDFSPSPRERHRRVLRVWGGPSFSNVNGARSNGDGEFDVELLPRTGDNNFGNRSRRSCELTANSQMLG